jgi:energy-coupling factor transport system ATP-binding protein
MNSQAYIEVKNMSFCYPRSQFRLKDISLQLHRNDITALVGENGSGKTTLGKILTGILRPASGEILIGEKNIKTLDLGEIGKKVGYLFQNPEKQIFASSVYEDVSFPLEINCVDPEAIKVRTEKILKELEIDHLKDKYPFNLSHGEKQRVALAGILVNETEYLILDEPTTALDTDRKELLGKMLQDIHSQGTGILIISHDEIFINKLCGRVLKMKQEGGITDEKI